MPNIAIVSTAHIHIKGFLDNLAAGADGRRVSAIWDDVADRGRKYAATCGATFVPTLGRLLRDRNVDAFMICSENTRHLPLLKKVLKTDKPVFCDKPLCTTVKDARKIAALLKEHQVPLFCGYFHPFSGVMQAAAKLVRDGAFGQITRVRCRNAHHAAYGRWFDHPDLHWFYNPALSGGGAFMDMGTHAVHLLRTLFGPVTEVGAIIGNQSGIYPTVDDFGIAQLKFASGIVGTAEAAWTQTGGIGGLEIVGSESSLWNNGKEYVIGSLGKEPTAVIALPEKPTRVDRLVAVLKGQVTEEELEADLVAIMDSVAIMEAAYKSSRSGQWTKVETV
jgi:predicted dehydrogenase